MGRRIVIHAIMARIIGKEMIYLYCVPFGDTLPYLIRSGKPTMLPTKLVEESDLASTSKRGLYGIHGNIAAGHDHHNFFSCQTVFYFVSSHQ